MANDLYSSQQVGHFDDMAANYKARHDKVIRTDSDHFYRAKIQLINARLPVDFTPRRILDFGCGTGRLTKLLAANFPAAEILAFDPSKSSIDEAAKVFAGNDKIKLSTDLALSVAAGETYDMVVAAGVFHHISSQAWLANMQLAKQLMAPSAHIYIFEHNPLSPLTQLLLLIGGEDKDAELVNPWKMAALMRKAELQEIKIEFISFFPPALRPLLAWEKFLTKLPMGAQYLAHARLN